MNTELFIEGLFPLLITGNRVEARRFVQETIVSGTTPEDLVAQGYWSLLHSINSLYRNDKLTCIAHRFSTRLLRSLVDQAQAKYTQKDRCSRSILMFCGSSEGDDLTGQIMADLAEADGYEVRFGGGGVAADEILAEVGEHRPDILLLFGSGASDAPHIRQIIDTVRSVGSCPNTQIAVGGGVFARATGLAEEIGADLWADDPYEMLERLHNEADRRATPDQRTVGRSVRDAAAA
jgi:methanogenic corrinoid protein MtbC1